MKDSEFNMKLAVDCCKAFSTTAGIGCIVSDDKGNILSTCGNGFSSCTLCRDKENFKEKCNRCHVYGMKEAQKHGGKYVYCCPMGLNFFVSPIIEDVSVSAKITAGPFIMVDHQDYITYDIKECLNFTEKDIDEIRTEIYSIPIFSAEKVNQMSTLLFFSVGFMNNIVSANKMMETQHSENIQGQIVTYINNIKNSKEYIAYPFEKEKALSNAISQRNKSEASKILNELFGNIFFLQKYDFKHAKSRIYELLVLISRFSVEAGADAEEVLDLTYRCNEEINQIKNNDELCYWVTDICNQYIDMVFKYIDSKHSNIIHKSIQFVNQYYSEKITVDNMAKRVYLSTAYFSRVFKDETGISFHNYLNKIRIEKSKQILLETNLRIIDVSLMVGFEDQSYFTKVFNKLVGKTPFEYRASLKNTKAMTV